MNGGGGRRGGGGGVCVCGVCLPVRPSVCLSTNDDYNIVRGLASLLKEHPASDLNVAATAHTYIV